MCIRDSAQGDDGAKTRMKAFLEGKASKVKHVAAKKAGKKK